MRALPRDSALGQALHGKAANWSITDHLLALAIDHLAGANWQRSGGKGRKPKPVERPDPRTEQRNREYVERLRRLGLIPKEA